VNAQGETNVTSALQEQVGIGPVRRAFGATRVVQAKECEEPSANCLKTQAKGAGNSVTRVGKILSPRQKRVPRSA